VCEAQILVQSSVLRSSIFFLFFSLGRARNRVLESFKAKSTIISVLMKSSIFWDTTPCSPLKVNRNFRESCRLLLRGWRVSHARYQQGAKRKHSSARFALRLWTWRHMATHPTETSVGFQRTVPSAYFAKWICSYKWKWISDYFYKLWLELLWCLWISVLHWRDSKFLNVLFDFADSSLCN
jgi:hypothetical protein